METVLKAISDWIKSLLTAAIMSNLSGLFDDVNTQVGSIAQQVGTKPSSFEPRVFAMIEALSRNVVLPIACTDRRNRSDEFRYRTGSGLLDPGTS